MCPNLLKVFIVIVVVIYISDLNAAQYIYEKQSKVCSQSGCAKYSREIMRMIDNSVKICDDFYRFACGQFIKSTKIPDDKASVDSFTIIEDVLQDQLKTIVTSPIENSDIEPFKMVKKLYSACMNEEQLEERGLDVSLNIFERFGGWPVLKGDQWNEESWSWQNAIVDCRKNGYSNDYILGFFVEADFKNSSKSIIYIDQSYFWLDRAILIKGLDDPVVKAYHVYQVELAVAYGADRKLAEKEMKDALDFEIALASISLPDEKRLDASELYNPTTIKDLQTKHPYNDWLTYINNLLPAESQVDEDEVIIEFDKPFFNQLGDLLAMTPKRTIANYIMWRAATVSTDFMTDQLRKLQLAYYSVLEGTKTEEPRWKECLGFVTEFFNTAASALYIRKFFDEDSKKVALEMVNAIRAEFEQILATVPWMDSDTRKEALAKAKAIYSHIGYPDELMDDQKLIEFYKNVDVDENNFLESVLNVKKFQADLSYGKLREPFNKTDWKTHSNVVDVNAIYSPIENSIRFTAGILQGQLFTADRPRYMNYAAIGVAIGHEITHGFDDQGRQFDLDGNLVDWWGNDTAEAFKEKSQCFVDQYSNYTEKQTGLNLNGITTLGENIADNGGAKEAYLAYQNSVRLFGHETTLPGLRYTANQLFWITFAQTWCAVDRPETLKKSILTDSHSPNEFRVLGTLMNLKEFAADFQCPEGSRMNPVKKCEVW